MIHQNKSAAWAAMGGAAAITMLAAGPASAGILDSWGADVVVGGVKKGGAGDNAAAFSQDFGATRASASVSLRDGKIHASAWSSKDGVPQCSVLDPHCYWGIGASASSWDLMTVYKDDPFVKDGVISYHFDIDGTKLIGPWWGQVGALGATYFGDSFLDWEFASAEPIGTSYHSSGTIPVGNSITLYWMESLVLSAANGASADYSNTVKFSWTLPPGYSYQSQSGQFMADITPGLDHPPPVAAVPEPASWAILLMGFGLVGVRARGGRQLAQAG